MNISLTPALEKYIEDKLASGHYSGASEVVREALRLLVLQDSRLEHGAADPLMAQALTTSRISMDELRAGVGVGARATVPE